MNMTNDDDLTWRWGRWYNVNWSSKKYHTFMFCFLLPINVFNFFVCRHFELSWNWNYFFLFGVAAWLRGVSGRPELIPVYWYFAFFSDGLRILKRKEWNGIVKKKREKKKEQLLYKFSLKWRKTTIGLRPYLPGRNTLKYHQPTSYHQHYQIPHSNLEPKIM